MGGCPEAVARIVRSSAGDFDFPSIGVMRRQSRARAWPRVQTRFLCLGERLVDGFHLVLDESIAPRVVRGGRNVSESVFVCKLPETVAGEVRTVV